MKRNSLTIISALMLLICFTQCKNDNEELLHNIVLYNQPLSTIQKYTKGKWKLEYIYGGISVHKSISTHNSYMTINSDYIIMGDDSRGIVVNSPITWVKTDIGSNNFTYLLTYQSSPEYDFIYQIKNDTLVVRDYNLSDGYDYYYTKY